MEFKSKIKKQATKKIKGSISTSPEDVF